MDILPTCTCDILLKIGVVTCVRNLVTFAYGVIYRGSYMCAHVVLDLLNELRKVIECEACRAFYHFFTTILIDLIIHEYES